MLRRFFPLYRGKVDEPLFRARLLTCLHANIRQDEAFETLKFYLLQQPALTSALVDLAETLHEHRPQDDAIIAFMTQKYLVDRQRHYRAEYFYTQSLSAENNAAVDEILALNLERTLKQRRKDVFAAWLYFRAFERSGETTSSALSEQIYHTFVELKAVHGDAPVIARLASAIEHFDVREIEQWKVEQKEREEKRLAAKLARGGYFIRQQGLYIWDVILRNRKYVYYAGGAAAFLLIMYFAIPERRETPVEQAAKVVAPTPEPEAKFALQVSALKSAGRAQQEVARLNKEGQEAYLVNPSGRSRYYRIHVGKFSSKSEAEIEGNNLRQKKVIRDFFVVNYAKK